LDSSIDHINAQPRAKMNEMKNKLDENCEYVGYELSYQKFKAQDSTKGYTMNPRLKLRQ
jgi:hypothetical protein